LTTIAQTKKKMSSNAIHLESNIDMSPMDDDDEDVEKTPHHNITVVLKEVKHPSIIKYILSHSS
jgi:hypothetical protein